MKFNGTEAVGFFIGALAVIIFFSFLLSYPFMLLWNGCLVPAVPGLAEVGWLQMWGIIVLVRFLSGVSFTSKSKE